jgi:D-alanyl-D-alanine dipeptidase
VDIAQSLDFLLHSTEFVELRNGPNYTLDLRYASGNNFVGVNMYGPFTRAFLHKTCAAQLHAAWVNLSERKSGYKFLIFDALRPRSVQRVLWNHVKGTDNERYIANPDLGSLHNFGFAADLSILDDQGVELDMGAGFDDFRPIAQPQLEEQFLRTGQLSTEHLSHRHLLRSSMTSAGFAQLAHEWWHFNALPASHVRANYAIVE